MTDRFFPQSGRRLSWWAGVALVGAVAWAPRPAAAQIPTPPSLNNVAPLANRPGTEPAVSEMHIDGEVKQASCSTCGGGLFAGGCGSGCGGTCIPGRFEDCCGCCGNSCIGRALCGVYECICCPDPCYEPHWTALADSAFYSDAPRPVTQMRLRWDNHFDIPFPDRGEYWIAAQKANQPNFSGPCVRNAAPKGPGCIASNMDVEELSLYNEVASGRFSFFVEVPYREVGMDTAAISTTVLGPNGVCCNASGFADMNIGTKSLLLDCELLQVTFQFKTFIPIGNFPKGLGNAHVTLEPALLYAVKLTPNVYIQGESAYWIPIAGDPLYASNLFHTHLSLNAILWRILPNVQLIGTGEISEYSFIGGNYTSPDVFFTAPDGSRHGIPVSATSSMVSIGPGVRLNICDRIDFGVGSQFSISGPGWAKEEFRAEFRWRF